MFQGFSGFQVVRIVNIVVISERYSTEIPWNDTWIHLILWQLWSGKHHSLGFPMGFSPQTRHLSRTPISARSTWRTPWPRAWRMMPRWASARSRARPGPLRRWGSVGMGRSGWGDGVGGWCPRFFWEESAGKMFLLCFFLGEDVVGTGWNPKTSGYIHNFRWY